jgi:hypothetical protein
MEPKKSSPHHQPHAMEPKKSSPRGAGAAAATEAESPLSSLFYPPAPAVRFLTPLSCSMLCLVVRFELDVEFFFFNFIIYDDADGFLRVQARS